MHPVFRAHLDNLEPAFQRLISMVPESLHSLSSNIPERGIYLFSESGRDLYVGRTNTMRKRLRSHSRPSASHFQATFAMRLAREATQMTKATYKAEGSRASLVSHPVFGPAFIEAKARVARMSVRYVEETNPLRQALLEMYVAVSLQTPYNDFDNH